MAAEREVVDRLLRAHGADRLERAQSVRLRFSSGGLAFRMKGQALALVDAEAVLMLTRQEITVRGTNPRPWEVVVADSCDLKSRIRALHTGKRLLRWTPEEVGVFAAGALWTYVAMPLLVRDAIDLRLRRGVRGEERLVVRVDKRIAGHGPRHVLHVDGAGRVARHDYTATGFGRWATAAQTIRRYRDADGVAMGYRRRVTPRVGRWRLPWPTLVWIEVHDVALARDGDHSREPSP